MTENDIEEPGNLEPGEDTGGSEENQAPDISEHEEAVARSRGWVPKENYRGREEDWQDAKSFLDRNSSLQRDVGELRELLSRQDEEYADRIRRIEAANERIIQNDREKLIRELETAKRNAVELGDTEAYDRARQEESNYYRRIAEESREVEKPARRNDAPPLMPETQEWIRRNSWFNESPPMQQIALGFYNEAMEGMPASKDETRRLAYVEKRMGEIYPEKFGKQQGASSVEGGSRFAKQAPPRLDSAAEAAAAKFIKMGLIKDRAEYIKMYNDQ